jgi:tetratricopeptide (TPR) repeat protein
LTDGEIEAYQLELAIRNHYAISLYESGSLLRAILQFRRLAELYNGPRDDSNWDYDTVVTYENLYAGLLVKYAGNLMESQRYEPALAAFERALTAYETMHSPKTEKLSQCGKDYETLLRELGYEEQADTVRDRVLKLLVR